MLTVKEINEVSFGKAGFSGYKPEDVDNFIDEVAASFQQLEAERDDALKRAQELAAQNADLTAKNSEIQEKLAILAQRIETYRADEEGIKDVLLSAQKLSRDTVQEANDKAEIILQDARDSARQILDGAKAEASRTAKEYMAKAEEKKEELEEMKRQVSAFRSSLLEMYKKHLECINHIPNFRQKEALEETREEEPEEEAVPEPVEKAAAEEPAPVQEEAPQPKASPEPTEPVAPQPEPQPVRQQPKRAPRPEPPQRQQAQPTLHDRVDYTKEQLRPSGPVEDGYEDGDLSEVGINLKAYSDIPETLRQEKNSHYSNLEFGEGVDLGKKKRRK